MINASLAKSSTLVIASMHRSGSSLTAALLQSARLHIGTRLMKPLPENIKGYFENLDFCEFHEAILESQEVSKFGWTLQEKIDVEENFIKLAQELVTQNAISALWGWKDPRTTLFLDFWAELLPTANFLLIYRSPWEVVDSLYRRQSDEIFKEKPELAVKFWIHYNTKILNFVNRFPERCFLINIQTLISTKNLWIEVMNEKFSINLQSPEAQIYDVSLLHTQAVNSYRPSAIAHYFPEAIDLLRELDARAWQGDKNSDLLWQDLLKPDLYRTWAFQDWVDLRRLEGQYKTVQTNSEQSQSQLHQANTELEKIKSQLHQANTELEYVKSELHQTEQVLEQSQSQLHQTNVELEQSQSQLHQTDQVLELSQSQLHQANTELEKTKSQLYQSEQILEKSQSELHQTNTQLEHVQSQLHQTEQVLEQSQSQLHETEQVLEQSQSQLHETKQVLEQSQSQLHQTHTQLEQARSQLHETEQVLEQSQSQLHETEQVLEQSQSQLHQIYTKREQVQFQLHQTEQALEQSQMQISQSQAELEEVKLQLHQAEFTLTQTTSQLHQHEQKELERSQLQDKLIRCGVETKQMHYQLLVWEAWYAHYKSDSLTMQVYLQHSLKHTPFSRTQTILNWLESFSQYSSEKGCLLDSLSLTSSYEWQQLVKPVASKALSKNS